MEMSVLFTIQKFKRKLNKQTQNATGSETFFGSEVGKIKVVEGVKAKYGDDIENVSQTQEHKLKYAITARQKFYENHKAVLEKKQIELLNVDEFFAGTNEIHYKCHICGNEFVCGYRGNNITCPYCVTSLGETEVFEYISSLLQNVEIVQRDRTILDGLELDILIPSQKIAFEYNGVFWHSDKNKDMDYHLNKSLSCTKKGISLIHILEYDWLYRKSHVISSINSILGLSIEVDAFACELKEIDNTDYDKFIKENSIKKYTKVARVYGIFENDKLLAVGTFLENNQLVYTSRLNYKLKNLPLRFAKEFGMSFVDIVVDRGYCEHIPLMKENFTIIEEYAPDYVLVSNTHILRSDEVAEELLEKYQWDKVYDAGSLRMRLVVF